MFGLYVRFELKDEVAAAGFDDLVERTVPRIRSEEPGTRLYAVGKIEGSPLSRAFFEIYDDREAFETHEQQPYVMEFLEQREQYLRSYEVDWLAVDAGSGLFGSR